MHSNTMEIDREKLTEEMIRFLQKWGLWRDTCILTMGNSYCFDQWSKELFHGLPDVRVTEGVDPEEAMKGLIGGGESWGECVWKSFANPEHIFDMTFEGALCTLLSNCFYETRKSDISDEGWEYIFEHTDILEDFLYEKYECVDAAEFWQKIREEKFENPDFTAWDPLVFDTWEEYQEFCGYEEQGLPENYRRFDTYEKYLEELQLADSDNLEVIEPIWEKLVADAKLEFKKDCGRNGEKMIDLNTIRADIKEEFDSMFARYGLWYDMCFSWSLTCFRKGV